MLLRFFPSSIPSLLDRYFHSLDFSQKPVAHVVDPVCDGRHAEGTRCPIPDDGVRPRPMAGFDAGITLPDFPEFGNIIVRSTAFAKLLCTDEFLRHKWDVGNLVLPYAFQLRNFNKYHFEMKCWWSCVPVRRRRTDCCVQGSGNLRARVEERASTSLESRLRPGRGMKISARELVFFVEPKHLLFKHR